MKKNKTTKQNLRPKLCKIIKQIFDETNMTYDQWAKRLGYKNRGSIYQLITNQIDPTKKFFQILEVADIELESLFYNSDQLVNWKASQYDFLRKALVKMLSVEVQKHSSEMTDDEFHEELEARFGIEYPDLKTFFCRLARLPKTEQALVADEIKPAIDKLVGA